jgi:transcriptional regulator with XRE-family HTH domain
MARLPACIDNDTVVHMRHRLPQSTSLADRLRSARLARGLTQAALADASGTGRVTLARFESGAGSDMRLGTLARACAALDLDVTLAPKGAEALAETRLAREKLRVRQVDARRRHAELAVRLLAMPPAQSAAAVRRARAVVDRWERDELCSSHYIERWRDRLSGGVRGVAQALIHYDEWTDALLQNTPWSFALERPSA